VYLSVVWRALHTIIGGVFLCLIFIFLSFFVVHMFCRVLLGLLFDCFGASPCAFFFVCLLLLGACTNTRFSHLPGQSVTEVAGWVFSRYSKKTIEADVKFVALFCIQYVFPFSFLFFSFFFFE
jgi:hypothetical protein